MVYSYAVHTVPIGHVADEHLKCGHFKLRCAVMVTCTLDFEEKRMSNNSFIMNIDSMLKQCFGYIEVNKIY